MHVKIKESEIGLILAVCDSGLLDQYFEEDEKQLDLTSDFYKGGEKSEDETADLMRNAYIIHLVGEKSCALAMKEGLLEENEIKKIKNIPYAQVLLAE